MVFRMIACLIVCFALHIEMKAVEKPMVKDSITVYVFLHESCIISQFYTLPLKDLNSEFSNEHIRFVGLFPNASSSPENIEAFKEKYNIPFDLETDHDQVKTNQLGATITPEVFVFDERSGEILYQGRIDDAYARVGKRKRITTTSELKDALNAISRGEEIEVPATPAVGCFIRKQQVN